MPSGDLGAIQRQRDGSFHFCPFPKSHYDKSDPCSDGEFFVNGPLDRVEVAIAEVPAAAERAIDTARPWFYAGLALLVFWLLLRAYEAYKR